MLGVFSYAQGTLTVTGQISPVTSPINIIMNYENNNVMQSATFATDSNGLFTYTTTVQSAQGYIEIFYSDCNGTLLGDSGWYANTPTLGLFYDFGILNYCPNGSNQTFVQGVFQNAPGPINYSVSLDNGVTYQNFSTSPNGIFSEGFSGLSGQNVVYLMFTDCNGNNVIDSAANVSSSATQEIFTFNNLDFCTSTNPTSTFFQVQGEFSNTSNAVNFAIEFLDASTNTYQNVPGVSNGSGMFFIDSVFSNQVPTIIFISYENCNGVTVVDSTYMPTNLPFPITFDFGILDYCPNTNITCMAAFMFSQNVVIDSFNNIISTGNVMIIDSSYGSNLTYTWNFGDGSPLYTGTNFTHTYANVGPYFLCLTVDNGAGCSDTYCDSIMVNANGVLTGKTNAGFTIQMGNGDNNTSGPNSINTIGNQTDVKVYPNPASENITLSFETENAEKMNVTIYSITGQKVLENNFSAQSGLNQKMINVENLETGVYIIKLKSSLGFVTKTISIK